jgi:glycogen operon protein
LRAKHPVFRRKRFFTGRPVKRAEGEPLRDVEWLNTDATPMTDNDWESDFVKSIGMFLNGDGIRARDGRGQPITDSNFLLYFNASEEGVDFLLPSAEYGAQWDLVLNTENATEPEGTFAAGDTITVGGRSVIVLCAAKEEGS